MNFRRGQGATDYLVILGAVLLVALVIVSLLGWFPSLGGATREQQSRAYWSSATPFAITTIKVNNTSVVITLSNRLSERLNLTNITLADAFGNSKEILVPSSYTMLNAGEEQTLLNNSWWLAVNNPCSGATSKAGNPYEFKTVTLTYTQGSITDIKQTGAQPLSGRCS